jgi:hypothetical protein
MIATYQEKRVKQLCITLPYLLPTTNFVIQTYLELLWRTKNFVHPFKVISQKLGVV